MKFSVPLWVIFMAALLATAAILPFATTSSTRRDFFSFEVDMTSTAPGRTQLFFDVGRGFSETDSSVQPLRIQNSPTRYSFVLPSTKIKALRFDPIDAPGTLTLSHLAIVDFNGHVVKRFSAADVRATQQIQKLSREGVGVRVETTPDANDPNLELRLDAPLNLKVTARAVILEWLWTFGVLLLVITAIALIPSARFARYSGAWLAGRPVTTLAAISVLAVGLQCYPVIFAGRSFVSPNNGSPFYYETFPTLPGSTDTVVENVRGSDVAALFHQSLYYPSIQREALFKHHELPLWNRYSTCGLPLYGQGQSMFGSLLNFIPILGDSSAWSWDLRYLLNRWLFAFGLGICVWLLTRCVTSASVIAVAGVFSGYFFFRANHMAQFAVESAPWILVGWLLVRDTTAPRPRLGALAILALANWEVINSGTVKEAWIVLACVNAAGALVLISSALSTAEKWRRMLHVGAVGAILLLLCAPLIWSFVRAMQVSYTVSEVATVAQMRPWQFIGFFDDMFYARLFDGEPSVLPSTNLLIYAAVGWTLVSLHALRKDRAFAALSLVALAAGAIVFGIIPGSWLLHVPVVRNIGHTHNTFSCVLMVIVPLLAGFGIRAALQSWREGTWLKQSAWVAAVLALPLALYFWESRARTGSEFFHGYFPMLILALLAIHIAAATRDERLVGLRLTVFVVAGGLLLWRHGQHVHTPFDTYVFNPGQRADFRAPSAAAKIVQARLDQEPSRPAGLNMNLFCGYSEMLGWESIYGIDAVRNHNYDTLLAAGGISKLFWPIPDTLRALGGDPSSFHEEHLGTLLPLQNLLNVRYYLATHGTTPAPEGLKLVQAADLDVYESDEAWPRAFFTDSLFVYEGLPTFIQRLRTPPDRRPFAALTSETLQASRGTLPATQLATRAVNPAHNYVFTSNSTTFTVDASGPGIVTLTENDYPGDFQVTVNNSRSNYVRVNHSFKGVFVPRAGTYEIAFTYWPKNFGIALVIAGVGLLLGIAGAAWLWRLDPKKY